MKRSRPHAHATAARRPKASTPSSPQPPQKRRHRGPDKRTRRAKHYPSELLMEPPPPEASIPDFNEISDPRKRAYLQALCREWHFAAAAHAAQVDLRTGWAWRGDTRDQAFQAALKVAEGVFVDRAERALWRRGVEGYLEPVFQQGGCVGVVRKFSDVAAIFMLKGARPTTYRENVKHEHEAGQSLLEILRAVEERRKAGPQA